MIDYIDLIVRFESGETTDEETLVLFAYLIRSGAAWHLQGYYGRTAADLINSGLISPEGEIS